MTELAYSESESPIKQGAADHFSMELERFGALLDQLQTVLEPALRPPSPEEASREEIATSELRKRVYRLGELNFRLSRLIERIDV
jgi:hypothetical protein